METGFLGMERLKNAKMVIEVDWSPESYLSMLGIIASN